MGSRSLLGCQHPYLLVLGLALTLLHGLPGAEAGVDPTWLARSSVYELASPEFQRCHARCVVMGAMRGDPPTVPVSAMYWVLKDAESRARERNTTAEEEFKSEETDYLARNMACFYACDHMLSDDEAKMIAALMVVPDATPHEIRKMTRGWIGLDPTGYRADIVERLIKDYQAHYARALANSKRRQRVRFKRLEKV